MATVTCTGVQNGSEPSGRSARVIESGPRGVWTTPWTLRSEPGAVWRTKNRTLGIVLSTQNAGDVALPPSLTSSDWSSVAPLM